MTTNNITLPRALIEQLVGALNIGIAKHWDLATDASIGDAITAGRAALEQTQVEAVRCRGSFCIAGGGIAHSKECVEDTAKIQGWTPTQEELNSVGPSVVTLESVASAIEEQWGHVELWTPEIADRIRALKVTHPQASEPIGINGLTEAETDATMSVRGLSEPAPKGLFIDMIASHGPGFIAEMAAIGEPAPKCPPNCGTGHCSCIECVMEPAPSTVEEQDLRDAQEAPFEAWWDSMGQDGLAGGGSYEKTFAWNAWIAAIIAAAR